MIEMQTTMVALKDMHPYAKNAKKHDRKQIKNIAMSIKQYGFVQPIVLDKNNEIVIGHGRYYGAMELKLDEAPAVYVTDLNDDEVRALRIADNKLNESAWDEDLLKAEIDGLDFGLLELDFDLDPKQTVREDDYEPNPPAEPLSKRGEVFQLGRHRLMCGDSTILSDVEKLMGGIKADMLLTDPPYNIALGKNQDSGSHVKQDDGAYLLNDNLPEDEFKQFLTDAFSNAAMVMKPGAAFHIWHADTERLNFELAVKDAGMIQWQCLIWVKDHFTLSRKDFQWQHEPCLYGEKPLPYPETADYEVGDEHEVCTYGWVKGAGHYWFKNRKQSTVLYFDRPKVSKEHPTMKPITLFDYEMKCNTLVDDVVLDLFGGSGTTVMAAEQNGRTACLMEFDPKFVDVIIDRWQTFTGETVYRLNEDGSKTAWGDI